MIEEHLPYPEPIVETIFRIAPGLSLKKSSETGVVTVTRDYGQRDHPISLTFTFEEWDALKRVL